MSTGSPRAPLVISPIVRQLARENGLDVARLIPTGPRGVLLRWDVEQAIARAGQPPRSRIGVPDVTAWVEVDATDLLAAQDALRAAEPARRIGWLARLARICVAGLQRFPELNATVDSRAEIVRFSEVHLGCAVQGGCGPVVPVIRNAHRMTTAQLAAELARLTGLARSGPLSPELLSGGTFTLSDYGVFGLDGSTPVNHPAAALLGLGRVIDKPWVVAGALAVRKVTRLSISVDHRVRGGAAEGFLRFVADCVEQPVILIVDV